MRFPVWNSKLLNSMSRSMLVETFTLERYCLYSPRKSLSRKYIKYTIRWSKSFWLKQMCIEISSFDFIYVFVQNSRRITICCCGYQIVFTGYSVFDKLWRWNKNTVENVKLPKRPRELVVDSGIILLGIWSSKSLIIEAKRRLHNRINIWLRSSKSMLHMNFKNIDAVCKMINICKLTKICCLIFVAFIKVWPYFQG